MPSFGTLGQLLKIPPFLCPNMHSGGFQNFVVIGFLIFS
jgi:hypothetical protein